MDTGGLDSDAPEDLASGWPAGHFYSAIPSAEDLERSQAWRAAWRPHTTPGIRISGGEMLDWADRLADAVGDFQLAQHPGPGRRYGWANGQFNSGDAGLLTAYIAHLHPKRIIEVGAGYSTACMLDAIDAFGTATSLTTIEPYPQRLRQLVDVETTPHLSLIESRVQDIDLSMIEALEPGDILFIDSSHVAKAGSDVLFEVFEAIPRVRPGVHIHIHDMPRGFEYPAQWQERGRQWSEAHLVRALLIGNSGLRIRLWPEGMTVTDRYVLLGILAVMGGRIGGSMWLEVQQPPGRDPVGS